MGASTTTPTFWTSATDMSEHKRRQVRLSRQPSAGILVKRSKDWARAPLALDSGSSESLGEGGSERSDTCTATDGWFTWLEHKLVLGWGEVGTGLWTEPPCTGAGV